ncbi:transcription factor Adf-1 [Elysia marginata]|uniref:Transcription factor Adf-1 n=1 Tax=Elysia marginata TaxID=1093978 RepID=A0AAV4H6P2_9GAST|nr:transcription factor Adf-1 [Elysia marginata]
MADEALIAAVQKRDTLCNKESNEYSKRILRRKQWEEIAVELKTEAEIARKRWTRLRDYFQRNHKNMTSFKSGSAGGKIRKWYLYDALSFLIPFLGDRPTTSNIGSQDSGESDLIESSSMSPFPISDINCGQETQEKSHSREGEEEEEQQQQQQCKVSQGRKKKFTHERMLKSSMLDMEMIQTMKDLGEGVAKSIRPERVYDEDELCCLSLVPKMKELDTIAKLECQAELNSVVIKHLRAMQRKKYT